MTSTCFICHSSMDAVEAMQLAEALESRGCKCWIAPRDIPAGASYPNEIVEGIRRCGTFIILLTNQAAASPHILRELEMAVTSGKKVIQIRLPGLALGNSMEYLVASLQWIEVSAADFRSAPEKIAARILDGAGSRLQPKPAKRLKFLLAGLLLLGLAAAAGVWMLDRIQHRSDALVLTIPPPLKPEPPPPPAIPVAEVPNVSGPWTCTVNSQLVIVWNMTLTHQGTNISGRGNKILINNEKAGRKEKATILDLKGALTGTQWSGTYTETSPDGSMNGYFQVTFSKDFKSFDGELRSTDKKRAAGFSGTSK